MEVMRVVESVLDGMPAGEEVAKKGRVSLVSLSSEWDDG